MERLRITEKEQKIDSLLLLSAGAVIGAIGLIAEGKILSEPGFDINTAVKMVEGTIVGVGLSVAGGAKLFKLTRKNNN